MAPRELEIIDPTYTSHSQVVSTTGVLSEPERELASALEALQSHALDTFRCAREVSGGGQSTAAIGALVAAEGAPPVRGEGGRAPTAYESRAAFILLFGAAKAHELALPDGSVETVRVL